MKYFRKAEYLVRHLIRQVSLTLLARRRVSGVWYLENFLIMYGSILLIRVTEYPAYHKTKISRFRCTPFFLYSFKAFLKGVRRRRIQRHFIHKLQKPYERTMLWGWMQDKQNSREWVGSTLTFATNLCVYSIYCLK